MIENTGNNSFIYVFIILFVFIFKIKQIDYYLNKLLFYVVLVFLHLEILKIWICLNIYLFIIKQINYNKL